MTTKILRSPNYAASSIVLKTGDLAVLAPVDKHEFEISNEVSTSDQAVSIEEQHKNYAMRLAELEAQKQKLDSSERELDKRKKLLDEVMDSYKIEIDKEIRTKCEAEYSGKYNELNSRLLKLIDELLLAKNADLANMEDEVCSVVYEATCKIIGKSVADRNVAVSIVREVIHHAQDRMRMVIHVSPADFELIQDAKELLSKGLSNRIDVLADDHIVYGGCLVETEAGSIDGRLEQQLNSLLELILSQRAGSNG